MPITGPIPLPETGMDAFLNELQRGQENQYRSALTQQAQANAQRAQVISGLLNQAFNSQGSSGTGTTGGAIGQGSSGMDMLYRLGILKPTPQELASIQAGVKGKEQLQKETQESAYAQLPLNASFNAMDTLLKDPEYKENAGTLKSYTLNSKPFGLPLGSMLQHNLPSVFPSSVVQKLSSGKVHMGNITVGVTQKFKGPFKQLTAGYIDSMKPTENDSAEVQQAKITQLKLMSDLSDRQNERIDELSRQGMSPTQAIIQSTKELMPEFQRIVSESIENQNQKQAQAQEQSPAQTQASPVQATNQNYSQEALSNQAISSGEGIANVPVPKKPSEITVTNKEIQELVKRKHRTAPEIVSLLLKKGYKIEGMKNAKR
jgi:uncharacterized protein YoaH (UPF0181 family)